MPSDRPTHARLAPSSASRWTVCTASVGFIEANWERLPKGSTVYADEGTTAHAWASAILTGAEWSLENAEMRIHVANYVEFVRSKVHKGDRLLVEQRIPLFYAPGERGTVDAAIIGPKSIYIADLKYGVGVSVEARGNKQLAIYAESLIRELEVLDSYPDDTLVTLAIFQPRDRNNPEPVRLWVLSRGELGEFCKGIDFAAQFIRDCPSAVVFVPDPEKQCFFCPAQGICEAFANHSLTVVPEGMTNLDAPVPVLPQPGTLSREQRVRIIQARKGLEQWLEAVENQEVAELMANAPPMGLKLVEGKSNRQWADETAAEKLLRNYLPADQVRPPGDVVSPAAAEKLLKAHETSTKFDNKLAALITKPAGKPTLVPEADKRPALNFDPSKQLKDIDLI